MKIASFLSFRKKDGLYEDIDTFRNRSNKMSGSHRAFFLHIRKKCIVPMLEREILRTKNIQYNFDQNNCDVDVTPTHPISRNNQVVHSRRETRAASRTKNITDINHCFQVTQTTPIGRNRTHANIEKRLLKCTNPCLARVTGRGKKCIRCKRETRTVCCGGRGEEVQIESTFCCGVCKRGRVGLTCIPSCCPEVCCPCIVKVSSASQT